MIFACETFTGADDDSSEEKSTSIGAMTRDLVSKSAVVKVTLSVRIVSVRLVNWDRMFMKRS